MPNIHVVQINLKPVKKLSLCAKFRCFTGGIIFISFIFSSFPGFATWKKIAQFPSSVYTSFFFNEQRGFIGFGNLTSSDTIIKRTYDGGKTWLDCTTPSGYTGYMTDIFMKDSLNGWASIEDDPFKHGLWRTNDGGVTWQ